MNRCRICGQKLKDEDAKFGPDCQQRYDEALLTIETTEKEVGALFMTGDATVQKWLSKMSSAVVIALKPSTNGRLKHLTFAKDCMAYARRAAKETSLDISIAA